MPEDMMERIESLEKKVAELEGALKSRLAENVAFAKIAMEHTEHMVKLHGVKPVVDPAKA